MTMDFDPEQPSRGRNQTGQAMYRKGQQKRQRLVEATGELLKTTSFAELRPREIARLAGTSKSNFYLYFADVRAAVLAAVQTVSLATPEVLAAVESAWPAAEGVYRAELFVATYLRQWQAHAHVLRVRTALVAEGDPRFRAAEEAATAALLEALQRKIAAAQAGGGVALAPHARSLALTILALLDRLAAYGPAALTGRGVSPASAIHAAASMIAPLLLPLGKPSGRR